MKKNNKNPALSFFVSVVLAATAATQAPIVSAATFQIINTNDPGIGFNEGTAATPVGGNTGTTIGQQRLIAFQYAADIWGRYLYSNTPIRIGAKFTPLDCSAFSGILGSAGPKVTYRDFNGAPYSSTYYPVALANALYGSDLLQGASYHIEANFSSTIGKPGCMENSGWYYGLDGSPPQGKFDLVSVILHELGHGLGFLSLADLTTGQKPNGYDDAYIRNLERHGATPSAYTAMNDAQRSAANAAGPDLHWIGANVKAATSILSAGKTQRGRLLRIPLGQVNDAQSNDGACLYRPHSYTRTRVGSFQRHWLEDQLHIEYLEKWFGRHFQQPQRHQLWRHLQQQLRQRNTGKPLRNTRLGIHL